MKSLCERGQCEQRCGPHVASHGGPSGEAESKFGIFVMVQCRTFLFLSWRCPAGTASTPPRVTFGPGCRVNRRPTARLQL
eukprot:7378565-Prymnesium_polylepis.3